jgi:hypothetical protein
MATGRALAQQGLRYDLLRTTEPGAQHCLACAQPGPGVGVISTNGFAALQQPEISARLLRATSGDSSASNLA